MRKSGDKNNAITLENEWALKLVTCFKTIKQRPAATSQMNLVDCHPAMTVYVIFCLALIYKKS